MFGTWISDVQRALSEVFPADRSYAAEDLKSEHMPTVVGHFLSQALSRRAARIEFSVESEWFDAGAPKVQSALESYRKALTSTARYPQSAWQSSLERAVQFVVAYAVNPAVGLVSFVFGDSDQPLPKARIRERLEYFGTHQSLGEIIVGYLDRKKMEEIGPDDLRALVLKADRSLVKDFEPEDWVAHMAPLYAIAAVVREDESEKAKLPLEVLKAFFSAKDCGQIVDRLEALESVKGADALDVDRLRKVVSEQTAPVVQEPEPQAEAVPAERMPRTRVVRNDMHRGGSPSVVPRWMQFAGGSDSSENSPPPPSRAGALSVDDPENAGASDGPGSDGPVKIGQRAPVPDDLEMVASGDGLEAASPDPSDRNGAAESVPRWTQFKGSPPRPSAPAAGETELVHVEKRVLGHLNAVQRAWFINHLFGSDRARWQTVIGLLAEAGDWNEASEIIATEVFERHGVDIYSRPAVDFTNAVEARFR